MGENTACPKKTRRAYSEPQLTEVVLRPEEAVLGNCKMSNVGPFQASCASPTTCKAIAS